MIVQGNYYLISTRLGDRITIAHSQDPITGLFYGTISPSNYENAGDNVGIGVSSALREATEEEVEAWITWYTSPIVPEEE